MSKQADDSVGRLRSGDATALERRLLDAASGERPSDELTARMAGAIGIALLPSGPPVSVGKGLTDAGAPAPHVVASSSVVPWISGALVAVVVVGAFMVGRGGDVSVASRPNVAVPPKVALSTASPAPSNEGPSAAMPAAENEAPVSPPTPAAPRARGQGQVAELAAQIALVDAARTALAKGRAERALSIVSDYQTDYPSGTFRPEVSAIKIEALVKLGRKAEARALAERFVKSYGPGPLAERVSRLGGLADP
jgi:hypothetical protein